MNDINNVLVLGSGAVVIGQSCEYDYAAVTILRVLKEKNIKSVIINPNPATISTDEGTADKIYFEPLSIESVKAIIEKENIDAIYPTTGGDKGMRLALELTYNGYLEEHNIKLLGLNPEIINTLTSKELFTSFLKTSELPGIDLKTISNTTDGEEFAGSVGYPVFISPAYTVGIYKKELCSSPDELAHKAGIMLKNSSIGQIFIEKSVSGWKEIEIEVMRDSKGNCSCVCTMESIDSVGIHSGDSIVAIPAQTLSKDKIELLSDAAKKAACALKIEGNCCVVFAMDQKSDKYVILNILPGVSRTSVLITKATGYPVNRISAKINLGDSFEPEEIPDIDYCAVKMPKWSFENFDVKSNTLDTAMQSTGEVLCEAPNFEAAFMKAVRSIDKNMTLPFMRELSNVSNEELKNKVKNAADDRIFAVFEALKRGISVEEISECADIDLYFIKKFADIFGKSEKCSSVSNDNEYKELKELGFCDKDIDYAGKGAVPGYAAISENKPYYLYSDYGLSPKTVDSGKKKVLIIGSGPSSVGYSAELDYCVIHAAKYLKNEGFEVVLVNNNPAAVSTGTLVADRLYLEPVYTEDIINIIKTEKPEYAVTQFCGPNCLEITHTVSGMGVKILGVSDELMTELLSKNTFNSVLDELSVLHRGCKYVDDIDDVFNAANSIGYPVSIKFDGEPGMIAYNSADTKEFADNNKGRKGRIIVESYLIGAGIEIYAVCDSKKAVYTTICEHIDKAGVNIGDSIGVASSQLSISEKLLDTVLNDVNKVIGRLKIQGLTSFEFVIFNNRAYMLNCRPEYVRGIPFASKSNNIDIISSAFDVLSGNEDKIKIPEKSDMVFVRVPVFSFEKIHGADVRLSLGIKSTGEVIAKGDTLESALIKGLCSSGMRIKKKGGVLITVRDADKQTIVPIADKFSQLGFRLYGTAGTAKLLNENFIGTNAVRKIHENGYTVADLLTSGKIDYVISTSTRGQLFSDDDVTIRRIAVERHIPTFTSADTALALVNALKQI